MVGHLQLGEEDGAVLLPPGLQEAEGRLSPITRLGPLYGPFSLLMTHQTLIDDKANKSQ